MISTIHRLLFLCATVLAIAGAAASAQDTVLVTGDTEAHLGACNTCPNHSGRGGMDRRATAIAAQREAGKTLLLDAGNWLVGSDSMDSSGAVMIAAYDQLKYDVVNLSPKDLRWGKDQTLKLLKNAKFAAISATLLDEQTGKPLLPPYVVVTGSRTAVLGLCELPPGHEALPHVRNQLTGLRLRPAAEALDEYLPKAKAESDRVIVLYHGTAKGLRTLRAKVAGTGVVIAAAGVDRDNIAEDPAAPVVASDKHGQTIGKATLADGNATVEQVVLADDVAGDPAMQALVARFAPPPLKPVKPAAPVAPPAASTTHPPSPQMPPPPATQPLAAAADPPAVVPPPVEPSTPAETTQPAKSALPRVAAKQPHQPRGLAGVGLTEDQVHKTVLRGADFLWKTTKTQAEANKNELGGMYEGYHTLAALAMVKAGLHKRDPDFDRRVRRYLATVAPETIGTYAAGTLCMLVEAYGDPQFEPVQRRAARYLFEGHTTKGWDYSPKVSEAAMLDPKTRKALQVWGGRKPLGSGEAEHWKRATTQPAVDGEGDNSLAQYAVMGLQSAARAGVEVPPDTWRQVLALYASRLTADGGWGYIGPTSASSGSMTCAGTYAMTVARFNLGDSEPAVEENVEHGLAWLAENFSVEKNPPGSGYHYYYLYSLERVGRTLDTEFIGKHEWYPLGAKYLLAQQQADGCWKEGENDGHPELTTSFAILFLAKSTPPLKPPEVMTDGPGTLRTGLLQPPSPRVYIVLDCSGSMLAEMNGKTKFDLARAAVSQLLAELPDTTMVALRAYGHRKSAVEEGASEDTELVMQLAPIDRQAVAEKLRLLRARGKTPLARSLKEVATDHAGAGGGDDKIAVILLTDGGEDTQPREDPVAAAEELGKIKNVSLHIVGFDIGREDWGTQLRAMAVRSKGRYWPAQDGAALLGELRAAVLRSPGEFEVLGGDGAVITRGTFGETKTLPPGQYTFVTKFADQTFKEGFNINPGLPTAVLFDAGRFDVSAPSPAADLPPATAAPVPAPMTPAPPAPAAPTPAAAKFCTDCGQKLNPGQKFCPGCGKKL